MKSENHYRKTDVTSDSRPDVLLTSFHCKSDGVSEAYSGYRWVEQAARSNNVTLLSASRTEVPPEIEFIRPSSHWFPKNRFLSRLNGEIFLDYFYFDWASKRAISNRIREFDLVHYVGPMAPRYPCSVGVAGKRFIIGPLGGGLRVPESFRREIEGKEELFYKLKRMDSLRLRYDPWLRATFKAADMIVLNGRFMLDLLPEEFHGKCRFMLETGVDAAAFPVEVRESRSTIAPLELLYVGRLVPYKGLIYILKALDRMDPRDREMVNLSIIGDRGEDGYEKECRDFVVERGLAGVVSFLGRMPKPEILAHYRNCDLFVFPSLAEAGGNVVLEAMACGCPVVVSNCGGPGESVDDDCGFKIDPKDPEFLISELAKLCAVLTKDRDVLIKKGKAARKRIEETFDWRRKGNVMNGWYREILDR